MPVEGGPLAGKVAVVTGATRHAGRGVAIELGLAGATVYVTGRSVRGHPSVRQGSETIEETAEMVTTLGGKAFWAQVDHTDIGQTERFFDQVIREQGRIDLLVNCVAGKACNDPFLESDLATGIQAIVDGGHSHLIATHLGARHMAKARSGLIINVSDHEWDQFYAMEKALINRIALCVADELRQHNLTIVSLLPGAFFKCFSVMTEEQLRAAIAEDPTVTKCHTPRLIGRGVVALAADPDVIQKTGRLLELKELVQEYGFCDLDGRQSGEMW